jgi:hypothetical protein
MSNVIRATETDKGIIVHELENGETRKYLAVRGGLSWPLIPENLPAYFCMYGEEYIRFEEKRGRLCYLCECEALDNSLTTFNTKLTDAVFLYGCETLYTMTGVSKGEDYSGYVEALQKFIYDKRAKVHVEEAPWHERPDLGVHHIQGWKEKGLLEIPEGSLIRAQLQELRADNVKAIPETLNAVNALRFVVCSFEKDKPPKPSQKDWRDRVNKGGTGRFSTQGNIRGGYGR